MKKRVKKIAIISLSAILVALILLLAFFLIRDFGQSKELTVVDEYEDEGADFSELFDEENDKDSEQIYVDKADGDEAIENEEDKTSFFDKVFNNDSESQSTSDDTVVNENRQEQTVTNVDIEETDDSEVEFNPWE